MATDQSPPRLRLIITIAAGVVVTLFSLKFVFDSYFTDMMEAEAKGKIATPDELLALHADEAKRLSTSPAVPIDQAIAELSSKGRLSSTVITPQPSDDTAPLVGWAHLHDVSAPAAPGKSEAQPGEAAKGGDAGVAPTGASPTGASTDNTPPGPPPGFDAGAGAANLKPHTNNAPIHGAIAPVAAATSSSSGAAN